MTKELREAVERLRDMDIRTVAAMGDAGTCAVAYLDEHSAGDPDETYAGWTVVSFGPVSVLLESPSAQRRRVLFREGRR